MLVKEGHGTELYKKLAEWLKPLVIIKRDLATKKLKASQLQRSPVLLCFPPSCGQPCLGGCCGAMAIAAGVWGCGVRILLEAKS